MSDVVRKCYECGEAMELVLERPDPHEPAVRLWVCNKLREPRGTRAGHRGPQRGPAEAAGAVSRLILATGESMSAATEVGTRDGCAFTIHTDGAARPNPGRGGYGAVVQHGDLLQEIHSGCRRTTNNRMELMAVIRALESLPETGRALVYSDSTYVVNGMNKGWAKGWRRRGWRRKNSKRAQRRPVEAPTGPHQ